MKSPPLPELFDLRTGDAATTNPIVDRLHLSQFFLLLVQLILVPSPLSQLSAKQVFLEAEKAQSLGAIANSKQVVVTEVVKLLVSAIFAVDNQSLVFRNGIDFSEIFKNCGDRRLKALAQKLTFNIFIFLVLSGQDIERSLAVAGVHLPGRLERVDEHVFEDSPPRNELVAQEWTVGVLRINRFPSSGPPAETDDDQIGALVVQTSRLGGLGSKKGSRNQSAGSDYSLQESPPMQ